MDEIKNLKIKKDSKKDDFNTVFEQEERNEKFIVQ